MIFRFRVLVLLGGSWRRRMDISKISLTIVLTKAVSIRTGLYLKNRHELEMGEQHGDYKEARLSICVPSCLSAGAPVKKMLSVELLDY